MNLIMMANVQKTPHQAQGIRVSRENNLTPSRRRQWLQHQNNHVNDVTKDVYQVHKWREPLSRHKYNKKVERIRSRLTRQTIPRNPSKNVGFNMAPLNARLPPLQFLESLDNTKQLTAVIPRNDYMYQKEILFYSEDRKRKILNKIPSPISRIRRSLMYRYEQQNAKENQKETSEDVYSVLSPPTKDLLRYQVVENDSINEEKVTIVDNDIKATSNPQKVTVSESDKSILREFSQRNKLSIPVLPEFPNVKSTTKNPTAITPKKTRNDSVGFNDVAKTLTPVLGKYSRLPSIARTPVDHLGLNSPSKQSSTTVTGSQTVGTLNSRETRKSKKRRSLVRGDTRDATGISPHLVKSRQRRRQEYLMVRWKTIIRLSIWVQRLCDSHHIIVDDSYNIKYTNHTRESELKKPDILFDVTNYRTKNQMKVSETIKAILRSPPRSRSQQDINMVKSSLRNLKVIADHANAIQDSIARSGMFASFEGKRVVTHENRPTLNFYVLLAGSSVVIKEDERGNTNPTWFMQRGDVFGEREIFEGHCWGWSVVTLDTCEYLMIDKKDYKRIFISDGGQYFSDPDRGRFIKDLPLYHKWNPQILENNTHRCFFRYFKRGVVMAKDISKSDWIYVVKSGSLSVLKTLKVKDIADKVIYERHKQMMKAPTVDVCNPHLVEKRETITEQEHEKMLQNQWETALSTYSISTLQQLEIKKLLSELNIEKAESLPTVIEEETDDETKAEQDQISDNEAALKESHGSPFHSAYIQTGILKEKSDISMHGARNKRKRKKLASVIISDEASTIRNDHDDFDKFSVGQGTVEDFLSKIETASRSESDYNIQPYLKPVFLNLRTITKGGLCGLSHHLYQEQPTISLVSNGAECLMVNKKFYLDNINDSTLKYLRDIEHSYPTEISIEKAYWRLVAWNAFQRMTINKFFEHYATV